MATKMKIKKSKDGGYQALVLAKHPMETGLRKDKKTGEKIPRHFIKTMQFLLNDKVVAQANISQAVSKNPLIGVSLGEAQPGDKVSVSWVDNKGGTGSAEKTIK
jgi:sulfur-oxidizing protein SoxZ